jgi:hypothetical protein
MPRVRKIKTVSDTAEPKRPRRRAVVKRPAPPVTPISADEIAAEAYALFLARGGQHGDALADWLTAERVVRERRLNG